ncbi:hypothetical protein ACCS91_33310 [Rhizobium ruizarguesonis]
MQQLPSARDNRSQHFANLNQYRNEGFPAVKMLGRFWMIDETIYEEFLNMLPPAYCAGGFRMIEKLTDDISATFLKIGPHYWCGYTDRETVEPHRLLNHIHKLNATFNTGRLYQPEGQVITMQVLDDRTLFMDHSRGIAGEIQGTPPQGMQPHVWVMNRYDHNQYRMSTEAMALKRRSDVVKVRL